MLPTCWDLPQFLKQEIGRKAERGMAEQKGEDIELLCPSIRAFELESHPFGLPRGAMYLCLSVIFRALAYSFHFLSRKAVRAAIF